MNRGNQDQKTRHTVGDLVEALYAELDGLPFSEQAKQSLVAIMLADIMRKEGYTVSFQGNKPEKVREEDDLKEPLLKVVE
ncbi:MAG: hypothetical protein R6V10_02540 [bacterium]